MSVPTDLEPLNFGRYRGMPMRDVADNFPGFCEQMLDEEQEGTDYNVDRLRFAMLRRFVYIHSHQGLIANRAV